MAEIRAAHPHLSISGAVVPARIVPAVLVGCRRLPPRHHATPNPGPEAHCSPIQPEGSFTQFRAPLPISAATC